MGKPPRGMKVLAEGESYLESRVINICCGIKTSTAMGTVMGTAGSLKNPSFISFPGNESVQSPGGAGPMPGKRIRVNGP